MLRTVAEVMEVIQQNCTRLKPEVTALMTSALGMFLAEEIIADADSPPFDKSAMDGYAVRSTDCSGGVGTLKLIGEMVAGTSQAFTLQENETVRIFTGAPIPANADAVVMQERVRRDGNIIHIDDARLKEGLNIISRGAEVKRGESLLYAGLPLRPQEFGVLASVGKTTMMAYPLPRVSIIATGSELVEPMMKPMGSQIRNSNATMLMAQVVRAGGLPRYLGLARDNKAALNSLIQEGLQTSDILIVTGGVSVGDYDLVPDVLKESGAEILTDRVAMKPGKPFLFAKLRNTLIFGLPGNPVSSFTCFELFIRYAIRILHGDPNPNPQPLLLPLMDKLEVSSDRPLYLPAKLHRVDRQLTVQPFHWTGSFDLRLLIDANAIIPLNSGSHHLQLGESVSVITLEF
jgi:molybdopterin molybdotransferase